MAGIEAEQKLSKFEADIKDLKNFSEKLSSLFLTEYEEIINDILNLKEELFIDQIKEGVSLFLEDLYTDYCLTENRVVKLISKNIEEIKNKYKQDFLLVNNAWNSYEKSLKKKFNKDFNYLTGFRKHCINSEENACHNCLSKEKYGDKNCRFIAVNNMDNKKEIKFVICENCKKVYYSSFILARCYKCKVDYYTSLLYPEENPDMLLATWENYHCPQLINEKMKCINCHEYLYINMKNGLLTCLNNKCGFTSKPNRILWTCCTCKKEFKSGGIPYNPLDIQVTKKLVIQTIILKHKAHPKKMICGCKLNVYFTEFYHSQKCEGILYESELDDNTIIVCEKCKMITYIDRFIWTCPKCNKKFKNGIGENNNYILNEYNTSDNENSEEIHINLNDGNKNEKEKILNDNKVKKVVSPPPPKHLNYASKRLKNYKLNQEKKEEKKEIKETKEQKEEPKEEKKEQKEEKNTISGGWKHRRYSSNHPSLLSFESKEREKLIEKNKEEVNNDLNKDKEIKKEEEKKHFRKFRLRDKYFNFNKKEDDDKQKEKIYEKEKLKEKETDLEDKTKQRYISPRHLRKRKFLFSNNNLQEENLSDKNIKEEKNEIKINSGKELIVDNQKKEENLNLIFHRLSPQQKKIRSLNNEEKKGQNEKDKEKEEDINKNNKEKNDSIDSEEESSELDEEKEDNDIETKEPSQNPSSPRFSRHNYIKKKTFGIVLEETEVETGEIKTPESPRKHKKKNAPQIQVKIAMSKIPGVSEHLFNHIKKRMTSILNRCKIPVFNIEDYVFNKKLGEGGYAVIYSVFKKDDEEQKQFALKKIIAKTLTEIDKFTKEFEIMHNCIHENIMKIYGICIRILDQTTYALYVLMELSEKDWDKDIKNHIAKKKYYSENKLIKILRQLTSALLFMQQNAKISHRDIKPQNVLLFDGVYKIADFGEAKKANENPEINTLRGTELFMSPVLYSGLKHEKNDVNHDPYKSDVFSLGFCFLYAATLNFDLLYKVRDIYNSNMMNKILEENLNNKYSNTFVEILVKMLDTDENQRFNFEQLSEFIENNYDKEGNLKDEENRNNNLNDYSDNKKGINSGFSNRYKKFKK